MSDLREIVRPPHPLQANNASGIYWANGCVGGRCRLFGLSLPCRHALPHHARQSGCWARAPAGCGARTPGASAGSNASLSAMWPSLSRVNWTMVSAHSPLLHTDVTSCLVHSQASIARTCPLPLPQHGSPYSSRISRAALDGWHIRVAHVVQDSLSGRCVASVALMPFQTPQQGICFSAGNRPCSGRCPRHASVTLVELALPCFTSPSHL